MMSDAKSPTDVVRVVDSQFGGTSKARLSKLLRILDKQYEVLVASGSDEEILKTYSSLLKFLRRPDDGVLDRIFLSPAAPAEQAAQFNLDLTDEGLANCRLEDLESRVNDPATTRKALERIAIQRFKVPKGSMRSFSNRRMLAEKLLTLIQNEQAHTTIDKVARRQEGDQR